MILKRKLMRLGLCAGIMVFAAVLSWAEPKRLANTDRFGAHQAVLDAGWYFVPGVFVDPTISEIPANAVPVKVPGNVRAELNLKTVRYGTYICQLIIPWNDTLYIKSQQFETAYSLYANGALVYQAGQPASSAEYEKPAWNSEVHRLPVKTRAGQVLTLVMHTSSFNDGFFGFSRAFFIGEEQALQQQRSSSISFEVFGAGLILMMALYYLIVWINRPVEFSALAFSLLCFMVGIRPLVYGELTLLLVLPGISFDWLFRIGYLTMSAGMIAVTIFLRSMFPRSFPKPLVWIGAGAGILYSLVILFTSPLFISMYLPIVQYIIIGCCAAFIVCLVIALSRRETGAWAVAVGFSVMAVTVTIDILTAQTVITLPSMLPVGIVTLIVFLSIALTRSYAAAFRNVEKLAGELRATNLSMERFVPAAFFESLGRKHHTEVGLGEFVEMDMVVLFADIRSFTGIADELGPAGTFGLLNDWLARMGPIIRASGGFVDKYLGDGILALFPQGNVDVLACAVAMQRETQRISQDRTAAGFSPFTAGIGMHRGILALGTIGEPMRMDTTVISDTVNVASRLESITKEFGSEIIVSQTLLDGLPTEAKQAGHFIRPLGRVTVKGKRQPVNVCEVYDSVPEAQRTWKLATAERFAAGIERYFSQDFTSAYKQFKALVQENPADQACQYYARMARKLGGC